MGRRHRIPALVLLAAGLALAAGTLAYVRDSGEDRVRRQLEGEVATLAADLEQELGAGLALLDGLRAFFASSADVGPGEFHTFTLQSLRRHPEVRWMAWLPWVSGPDGAASFPVRYLEPRHLPLPPEGLDLSREGHLAARLARAREREGAVAFPRAETRLQDGGGAAGRTGVVVLYLPVTEASGAGLFQGYVALEYDVPSLMAKVLLERPGRDPPLAVEVELTDPEGDAGGRILHRVDPGEPTVAALRVSQPLSAPEGMRWSLSACPAESRVRAGRFDPYGYGLAALLVLMTLAVAYFQHALARHARENERLSRIDALTGVANRRALMERLELEWARCQRSGQPLGLLMADLDGFKALNDRRGHIEGDRCLREVASALRRSVLRPTDLVARFGGDEFAVVLPGSGADALPVVIRRIEAQVAALGIPSADGGGTLRLTLGACSVLPTPEASLTDLLQRADMVLYRAKGARAPAGPA